MSSTLLAVLHLLLLFHSSLQQNIESLPNNFNFNSLLASGDERAKAIEEMTKRAAILQNQREAALRGETIAPFSHSATPSSSTLPSTLPIPPPQPHRPTSEDDQIFLKKMKEQSEFVQNNLFPRTVQGVELFAPIPPPAPSLPFHLGPYGYQMNYFPAITRIAARPGPLYFEEGPRPQLPLRAAKNLIK